MLVYGYTSALETVAANLSIKRIVAAGIDPWRLDLFDPDPIELTVRGRKLYFRRLHDFSFAYRAKDGGQLIIGLHDGTDGGECFSGVTEETKYWGGILRQPQICSSSFQFHLTEYLQQAVRLCPKGFQTFLSSYSNSAPIDKCMIVYGPRSACAVNIRGDRMTFSPELPDGMPIGDMRPLIFTGEMLEEVTVPAILSPEVNWLLNLLEQFQPSVYGEAIRQCLSDKRPSTVEFAIPVNDLGAVRHLLEQFSFARGTQELLDASGEPTRLRLFDDPDNSNCLDFEISDVLYLGCVSWHQTGSPVSVFRNDGHRFSQQCLYSRKRDTITASRIALHDVGCKMARPLYAKGHFEITADDVPRRMLRATELKAEGIQIVEPSGCRLRRT